MASELSKSSKRHWYNITSLTAIPGHWSHYSLLKENITDSQDYVEGENVRKSFSCTNEGYL